MTPPLETEDEEYRVTVRRPKRPDAKNGRPSDKIANTIQGGLLLVGAALAILQAWQLCEFRGSIGIARDQLAVMRQEREAIVSLASATASGEVALGKTLMFDLVFRNSGEGVARKVDLQIETGLVAKVEPCIFIVPDECSTAQSMSGETLGAGINYPSAVSFIINEPDVVTGLNNGNGVYVVKGRMVYRDAFGGEHVEPFCREFNRDLLTEKFRFVVCSRRCPSKGY